MTPAQQEAMQAGRERARAERRVQQIERVRAFQAWLRAGARIVDMPDLPGRADYRAYRQATGGTA